MSVQLEPGKYVLAVSGGVDSMVLLDMLKNQPDVELVIAHFDHGIRPDSEKDRRFVQATAARLRLPFYYEEGKLGPKASEAEGRHARYAFFEKIRREEKARAILTAHHQDDLLETAILNLIRGTARKGLSALSSRPTLIRPLLYMTKADIRAHATAHNLEWREDSTNESEQYLRNYIRKRLLSRFSAEDRERFVAIIARAKQTNDELDRLLASLMHLQPSPRELDRQWFISLPHAVAKEFLAAWLRAQGVSAFDAKTLERVTVAAKVGRPGTTIDVASRTSLAIKKHVLALTRLER